MKFERNLGLAHLPLFAASSGDQTFGQKNPDMTPSILSIGYEKRDAATFIHILREYETQAVVDVRQSAFSRRLDFRRNELKSLLIKNGIEYFHLPSAGNPLRNVSNDVQRCLKMYADYISDEPALITEIADELNRITCLYPRIAMLCYEKCPSECHRTILINILLASNFQCSVVEV